MNKIDFPQIVKSTRYLLGEDQKTFAKRLNVDYSLISLWESGKRQPSFELAMEVMQLHGSLQVCPTCQGKGVLHGH